MDEADTEPSLSERLGGRWAISWQAFVITAPIGVASLIIAASAQGEGNLLGWFLAGVVAAAAVGIAIYVAHRTAFRNRHVAPVPVSLVVAVCLLNGVIFIVVSTVVARLLGLNALRDPASHVIATLIILTWWGLMLVLLLEARARFSVEREALIDRSVQQQLALMQGAEVADRIRDSLHQEVSSELSSSRERLERHLDEIDAQAADSLGSTADLLRETAQSTVRPLSHRLAERKEAAYPRPGIGRVLTNVIRRQPFRPLAVSLIYVVASASAEVDQLGPRVGLVVILFTVGLIVGLMSLANAAMRRWPQHHAVIFIAGIVIIEGLTVVLAPLRSTLLGTDYAWPDVAASVLIGTLIILVTSAFGSWRTTRQDFLRVFTVDVQDEEIQTIARSRALADAAREAAEVLHGTVQTRLIACAMAIDHAANTGDVIAVNQALVQARAILEPSMPDWPTTGDSSVAQIVQRKAALWNGLADVVVEVDPAIADATGLTAEAVGSIVEEAIANAIQHGGATTIQVAVTASSKDVSITVDDDGSGPRAGEPGLGTALFDRTAVTWSLKALPWGSRLSVRLPVLEGAPLVPSEEWV